eukprot:gnl/TRDRNA2_/TRDRNA2_30931_c0_seq1.p1 gnl/TRDRNA2_/TRDRNA2_30931_c0~~gnl/TRDRNA2_/TRDRNA2_30931_c0_seq1.p1  ORF type:complete len:449 (+),score=84.08 gnl/TRDRNA2_/TRDRNA2_30931_c0_seq1:79-1425(+)
MGRRGFSDFLKKAAPEERSSAGYPEVQVQGEEARKAEDLTDQVTSAEDSTDLPSADAPDPGRAGNADVPRESFASRSERRAALEREYLAEMEAKAAAAAEAARAADPLHQLKQQHKARAAEAARLSAAENSQAAEHRYLMLELTPHGVACGLGKLPPCEGPVFEDADGDFAHAFLEERLGHLVETAHGLSRHTTWPGWSPPALSEAHWTDDVRQPAELTSNGQLPVGLPVVLGPPQEKSATRAPPKPSAGVSTSPSKPKQKAETTAAPSIEELLREIDCAEGQSAASDLGSAAASPEGAATAPLREPEAVSETAAAPQPAQPRRKGRFSDLCSATTAAAVVESGAAAAKIGDTAQDRSDVASAQDSQKVFDAAPDSASAMSISQGDDDYRHAMELSEQMRQRRALRLEAKSKEAAIATNGQAPAESVPQKPSRRGRFSDFVAASTKPP